MLIGLFDLSSRVHAKLSVNCILSSKTMRISCVNDASEAFCVGVLVVIDGATSSVVVKEKL